MQTIKYLIKNNIFQLIILCQILVISCTNHRINEPKTTNSELDNRTLFDSIFYNKFQMRKPGFTGGDGVYSVKLPDDRTVWIFGDTFIGEVSDSLTRLKTNPMYIRNCFVVQDGEEMTTLHRGKPEEFISMIIPNEVSEKELNERDIWFWPGDGFVHKDTLNVFVSKFHQKTSDMWGFEFLETELAQFKLPDFEEIGKLKMSYSKENGVHYGHAVYKDKNYLYIYGLGNGQPYVARTFYDNLSSNWEFYDGEKWVSDSKLAKPMVDFMGSEQFSIFKLNDTYIFLSQFGQLSTEVYSFTSDTPFGPWENKQLLFKTPMDTNNSNLFTYNALAHPQFIENNKLLISYNTNSMELEDHFNNASIYKPRFMRVHLDSIIGNRNKNVKSKK